METGLEYMQELFQMKEVDIKEYSPLALAYIGDAVYELIIRSLVLGEGKNFLHCGPACILRAPPVTTGRSRQLSYAPEQMPVPQSWFSYASSVPAGSPRQAPGNG